MNYYSQLNSIVSSLSNQARMASHASADILSAIDEHMDWQKCQGIKNYWLNTAVEDK